MRAGSGVEAGLSSYGPGWLASSLSQLHPGAFLKAGTAADGLLASLFPIKCKAITVRSKNGPENCTALFYAALSRSLLRAATGNGRADDKLVGMLQVLLKALDPSELHVSGPDGGPIPIAAVVANVQSALGMRPSTAELPDAQT